MDDIADGSIHYVYTLNVLEHIHDDVAILVKLHAKLRPGGSLFVYVPAFHLLWSSMDDKVGHLRRYTRGSLKGAVKAAGFAVGHCRYADSAGYFATLMFKVVGNRHGEINRKALVAFDRWGVPGRQALRPSGHVVVARQERLFAVRAQTR